MTHELIHTSAPRGLHLGSDGYCTVAATADIPKPLADQLERLSGYRHRVKGPRPDLANNPVAVSHAVVSAGGAKYHVVSRIADAGFDHSGRTNYVAHHVALSTGDLPDAGPAWLCSQRGVFRPDWPAGRQPETLPADRALPEGDVPPRPCALWKRYAGDAGWAGVLAETYATQKSAVVVYEVGQPVLDLAAEALALIPPAARWRVTFNTYYTDATGADCLWRFVPAGSREATAADPRRSVVLRLDVPMGGEPTGELVSAARTGIRPRSAEPVAAPPARIRSEPPPRRRDRPIPARGERYDADEYDEPGESAPGGGHHPQAPAREGSAGPGLKHLMLGLALGGSLMFVTTVLVELLTDKPLLSVARGAGPSEPAPATAQPQMSSPSKSADGAQQSGDNLQAQLNTFYDTLGKDYFMKPHLVKEHIDTKDKEILRLTNEKSQHEKDLESKLTAAEGAREEAEGNARALQTKLDNAAPEQSPYPELAVPLPVALSADGWRILKENTEIQGSVELLSPPLGWKMRKGSFMPDDKSSGNGVAVKLKYDQSSGFVKTEPASFGSGIEWAAAVIRVKPKGQPYHYFQLAAPKQLKLTPHSPKEVGAVITYQSNIVEKFELPRNGLTFFGAARVKIGGIEYLLTPVFNTNVGDAKDEKESKPAKDVKDDMGPKPAKDVKDDMEPKPAKDMSNFSTELSTHDGNDDGTPPTVRMSISDGMITITVKRTAEMKSPLPEPIVTAWPLIVPRIRPKHVSSPPVVYYRIS